jgi:hypothetical protein
MKMEQRQSGDSGAEVKMGSVVMRRGEMERGSSGNAHARDKYVESSACGAVVTGSVW